MAVFPAQRKRADGSVEIRPREDAPGYVRGIVGMLATEARSDPGTLLSVLYDGSILASPRQLIMRSEIGDPDKKRNRALHLLSTLFSLITEQPDGTTLGADQYIVYDPLTERVLTAVTPEGTDPEIVRTFRLYMVLGRASAALDAHMVPVPTNLTRGPFAP